MAKAKRAPRRVGRPARVGSIERSARDALVASALAAIAANTFDSESIGELAKRAGVSQPLVHYHFESKEALWREAAASAFREMAAAQEAAGPQLKDLSPRERLAVAIRRFVLFSARSPAVAAMMMTESLRGGARLDWLVENMIGPFQRVLDGLVDQGRRDGAFKSLPTAHVTQAIIGAGALFVSAHDLIRKLYRIDSREPAVVERHADVLVELLLDGLCSTHGAP